MGGALAAIEAGFFQREIQEGAYRAQRAIESKEQIVVGVNEFLGGEETPIPMLTSIRRSRRSRSLRLQALRARRDPAAVERRRAALVEAARDGRNLMPPIVDAVAGTVTLGEIVESLQDGLRRSPRDCGLVTRISVQVRQTGIPCGFERAMEAATRTECRLAPV